MKLEERVIWTVSRKRVAYGETFLTIVNAFTTKEEAEEKLKEYSSCLGEFFVDEIVTWFPPEF